jgi:hypothetical protein
MKHRIFIFYFVVLAAASFLCAESFVVEKRPERISEQALKQEIVDVMGSLIEQESTSIAQTAQLQQLLCKKLRAFAQDDNKNFLKQSSIADLKHTIKKLKKELTRAQKESRELARSLSMLRSV